MPEVEHGPWEDYAGAAKAGPWEDYKTPVQSALASVPRPKVSMETSLAAQIIPSSPDQIGNGFKEVTTPDNPKVASAAMLAPVVGAGIAGATSAGRAAIPIVAHAAKAHPLLTQMAGSEAISQARHIPVVGKFIPPFSEVLPFLFGGKGKPEVAAEGGAAETAAARPTVSAPAPEAVTPPVSRQAVSEAVDQSLNVQPLKPNVPLREQLPTPSPKQVAPVPKESSVVAKHSYDAAAREFHVTTKAGSSYTYGEVTPEEAQKFTDAESKGKAWNELRSNHVQVKKNGQPTRPAIAEKDLNPGNAPQVRVVPPGDDLTGILSKSVAEARKKRQ